MIFGFAVIGLGAIVLSSKERENDDLFEKRAKLNAKMEEGRIRALESARKDMLASQRSVWQLNGYAGERTVINKQKRDQSLREGTYQNPYPATNDYLYQGEQRKCFEEAVQAIETVDCLDAGKKEAACEELKKSIKRTYFDWEVLYKFYV